MSPTTPAMQAPFEAIGDLSTRWPQPTREGFWWAKWRIADDGTPEGDEQTPSDYWEVVEVFENCIDRADPEHLRVFVGGQSHGQSLENFFWGPGPLTPPDALNGR